MGYRHRWMYYMTGLPGWMRFGFSPGWMGRSPTGLPPTAQWLLQSGLLPQYMSYLSTITPTGVPPTGVTPTGVPPTGVPQTGVPPTGVPPMTGAPTMPFMPFAPTYSKEQERQLLEQQLKALESQIEAVRKRLDELRRGS